MGLWPGAGVSHRLRDVPLGAGKYQIGPSAALIYTGIKNLTLGAIVQNPISYAGSPNRPKVNQMIITPTFTYNLNAGWFVGLTDYNFSFNWENGGAPTIPLGMQVGKVVRIGKQPMSVSIEAGGAAARPSGTPNPGLILGFEVSPIFNFHIGPGRRSRFGEESRVELSCITSFKLSLELESEDAICCPGIQNRKTQAR